MKILYVEDKPSENISRFIFLFRKYLDKEIVDKLDKLSNDDYGASPEEIKQVINSSNNIWFEFNFFDALKVINKNQNDFALFIIDRNLSDSDYDDNEIRKIEPNYSEEMSIRFMEREGDYFLQKLLYEKIDVMNRFFFLTANSEDDLRNLDDIKKHIDFGKFSSDNIIDKSSNREMEFLRNKINGNEKMLIRLENSKYLDILKKNISDKAVNEFMKLVESNQAIPDSLSSCRRLLENILTVLANKINPSNPECWHYAKRKKELKLSTFITTISFDEPQKYNSNTVIDLALKNIKLISNEFGAHQNFSDNDNIATNDTVQSLIYNLKDIIKWFDSLV